MIYMLDDLLTSYLHQGPDWGDLKHHDKPEEPVLNEVKKVRTDGNTKMHTKYMLKYITKSIHKHIHKKSVSSAFDSAFATMGC